MAYAFCPMGNIFAVSASDGRRERGRDEGDWTRARGARGKRARRPGCGQNFDVSIQRGNRHGSDTRM